ncbi:MAG: cytochrome c maturation protein CcmE [Gammaproteobacteria bacterium]|nr:cytochrome c maturation protein CcmE [Gammaproteobacteria bacterium]
MKPRHKRLAFIAAALTGLVVAIALVLNAFQDNLVFFFTPSEVLAREAPLDRTFRIGGMVQEGSVRRDPKSIRVHFVVTDGVAHLPVFYDGILPDLFREGQGVVAQGTLAGDGIFRASTVLAKHDENYMPPEAAEAMMRARQNLSPEALVSDTGPAAGDYR